MILSIITTALTAIYLSENVFSTIKWTNFKPLNCYLCLSFWLGLIFFFLPKEFSLPLQIAGTTGFIAYAIYGLTTYLEKLARK